MQFTQTDISNLNEILSICGLVDINAVVISDTQLSGVNNDRTCAMIVKSKIPVLAEGVKLGLSNLNILSQRLDIFKTDVKLGIEAALGKTSDIASLTIKGAKASTQFRATNPAAIKCPTSINDTPVKEVIISRDEAGIILNAIRAMSAKKLTIVIKKNNDVTLELSDKVNDLFQIGLENQAKNLGESERAFTSYYFTEALSSLLKAAAAESDLISITVCEASARLTVNGYELTLISPMDND